MRRNTIFRTSPAPRSHGGDRGSRREEDGGERERKRKRPALSGRGLLGARRVPVLQACREARPTQERARTLSGPREVMR
jgi:hypothetical protein